MLNSTRLLQFGVVVLVYGVVTNSGNATNNDSLSDGMLLSDSSELEKPPILIDAAHTPVTVNAQPLMPAVTIQEDVQDVIESEAKPTLPPSLIKTLDMSVPFNTDSVVTVPQQIQVEQKPQANLFAAEMRKKHQPLRLDGTVLMTHEQEVEKRNSLDGAGIAINVKP